LGELPHAFLGIAGTGALLDFALFWPAVAMPSLGFLPHPARLAARASTAIGTANFVNFMGSVHSEAGNQP
jgi:hypothetical protein